MDLMNKKRCVACSYENMLLKVLLVVKEVNAIGTLENLRVIGVQMDLRRFLSKMYFPILVAGYEHRVGGTLHLLGLYKDRLTSWYPHMT